MFLLIVGGAYKDVAWVCVAVDKAMVEDHLSEDADKVFSAYNRVDSHLLDLLFLIYLCACNELHCNHSL
jgi:hypothetical protein